MKTCGYYGPSENAELTITLCQSGKCCATKVPPQGKKNQCVRNNYPLNCDDLHISPEIMSGNVTTDASGTDAWWGDSISIKLDEENVIECSINGKVFCGHCPFLNKIA